MPKRLIFYFTDKSSFKTIEMFYLQRLVFNYNLVTFILRYFYFAYPTDAVVSLSPILFKNDICNTMKNIFLTV